MRSIKALTSSSSLRLQPNMSLRTPAQLRHIATTTRSRSPIFAATKRIGKPERTVAIPFSSPLVQPTRQNALAQNLVSSRSYSTSPNQEQVMQSFGTPFAHFIYTISRIARMITFSAVGVVTIGLVGYEATHQYIEHVAMSTPPSSSSPSSEESQWGWSDQALEESWNGTLKGGTDSRLGIKGRHALRSAWMCVNWGGGISPGVLFGGGAAGNSGLGRTAMTSMAGAKTLQVHDSMILAMQYLQVAIRIAASKDIKLPDVDSIRAGLVSPEVAKTQMASIDPLALALESKLAAARERQGSRGALEAAIGSYEKLFDIASYNAQAEPGAGSKLVRLAVKIGDLNNALGHKEQAKEWLQRAVSIAGVAGAKTLEWEASSSLASVPKSSNTVQTTANHQGFFSGWFSSSSGAEHAKDGSPVAPAAVGKGDSSPLVTIQSTSPDSLISKPLPGSNPITAATPTPSLTRSLITSLISLSALYAQKPTKEATDPASSTWQSSLEKALRVQTGALKLASIELDRVGSSSSSTGRVQSQAEQLHTLWLLHHKSIISLHLAETIYALEQQQEKSTGRKLGRSVKALVGKKDSSESEVPHAQSLAWLQEAAQDSQKVIETLADPSKSKSKKSKQMGADEAKDLKKSWKDGSGTLSLFAGRIVRDAQRVQQTAERMDRILRSSA